MRSFLRALFENNVMHRFVKGAFWAITGNVAVKGLSLLATIFIARFLGSTDFGGLTVIRATLSVFSLVATFGLGFAVTKYIADKRSTNPQEIGVIISASKRITVVSSAILILIILIFSSYIAQTILDSKELTLPLRISTIYLFFTALNTYQIGVLGGLEAYRQMAKTNVIVGALSLPISIVFTYYGGLNGAVIGLSIGLIINWALFKNVIDKEAKLLSINLDVKASLTYIKKILKFSYPLAMSEGVYSISTWAMLYILLINTNYAEVGIFNSANYWAQMILFLPFSLSNVVLSFLSNQKDNEMNYYNILRTNIGFNLLITILLSIVIGLSSEFIFGFYGSSFNGGAKVLVILVFATIPMSIVNSFEQVYISKGKTKTMFRFRVLTNALRVFLAYKLLAIWKQGESLAYAWIIAYTITIVFMVLHMYKYKIIEKQ